MSQHAMDAKAPIDESVVVPDAVKRAVARSNELHAQVYNTQVGDAPPVEPPVTPPGNPPPIMPAPAQAPTAPTVAADGQEPGEPQRSAQVDPTSWEARYWAMKGRFDQTSTQTRDLRERIVHLENLLADMETPAPVTMPAAQPPRELKFITDKDREDYGPEMIDLIERAARGIAETRINEQQAKIVELERQLGTVGQVVAKDATQKVLDQLDEKLPQWRGLNTAPEFLQWADLPDVYSGVKRIQLMRQAFEQHNAPRVLAFFKGYLAEQSAASAPATNGSTPPPIVPTVRLEDLAAPGRVRPTTPPTESDRPVITGAQIKQFYEDVRRGRYNGREAEQKAIEAQIFQAQREGRLQTSG